MIDPVVAGIIVALLGPVGAYLLAARKMSGKIGTSDAEQLWQESKAIRDWSRERIEACDREILDLRSSVRDLLARVTTLEAHNASLSSENTHLTQKIRDLSDVITAQRAEIVELHKEQATCRSHIEVLEDELRRERESRNEPG